MPDDHGWYLTGPEDQSVGPLSAEDVLARRRQNAITDRSLCWREGMADWAQLADTEPFASELRRQRVRARKSVVRLVIALAVVSAAIAIGYSLVARHKRESAPLRQATALIDAGQYRAAIQILESFLKEHPASPKALEPLGIATLKEYAAAPPDARSIVAGDPREHPAIKAAVESLVRAGLQGPQAEQKLAAIASSVPPTAPDRLGRMLALASVREKLKAAAPEVLADELLQAAAIAPPEDLHRHENELLWQCVLAWKPAAAGQLLSLLTGPGPAGSGQVQSAMALVARSAAGNAEATQALAATAISLAGRIAGESDYAAADVVLNAAQSLDPAQESAAGQQRLELARSRIAAGDCAGALRLLGAMNVAPGTPAAETASTAYLDIAQRLRASDKATASAALSRALELKPDLATGEDVAALAIEVAPAPGPDKLARSLEFIARFPESGRRLEVQVLLLDDAVAFFDSSGWQPDRATPYLRAADEAAADLLRRHPDTARLDERVLALARRFVQAGERQPGERERALNQGIEIADALLVALPASPRRLEIEQAKQEWRQALGRGTLDPRFDTSADYVRDRLKILDLSAPGTVQTLADQPRAFHVVRALCASDRFNSAQVERLRAWVADGGVLWLGNSEARSILDIFNLTCTHHYVGPPLCRPASAPADCAISAGCSQVHLNCQFVDVTDLNGSEVIPLLSNGERVLWSLARYGKGWISDVKPVDVNRYDGARFWLNFQLFSMGECGRIPVDGVALANAPPAQTPARPADTPARPPVEQDPAEKKARELCGDLAKRPADLALLAELRSVCSSVKDEYRRARCLAICCLGLSLAGRQPDAEEARRQMPQGGPGARFTQSVEPANLVESCVACAGRGQISQPCGACAGSGGRTCAQCGGAGTVSVGRLDRRPRSVTCPLCKGQRKTPCPSCAGKGSTTQRCATCGGRGRWLSEKKTRELYSTYLRDAAL